MTRIVTVFLMLVLMASPLRAQEAFTGPQEERIKELVREYLLANPEIVRDVLAELQRREQEQQLVQARNLEMLQAELTQSGDDPIGGNPDGTITVVEFFDYNCPYCRRAKPEVLKLLNNDKRIRYVFKEFPVLSESSVVAARLALAVWKTRPEKYFDFHNRLMTIKGRMSIPSIQAAVTDSDLDWEGLNKRAGQPDIVGQIQKTLQLADMLQISGTPTFVIGNEIIPGFVTHDVLQKAVDQAAR